MVIGIINYGVGNIGSVIGSINNLGFKYKVIENAEHVYQMYTITVESGIRNELVYFLKEKGIGAGVHFTPPLHLHPYYKKNFPSLIELPNAEYLGKSIVTLPMYPSLENEEIEYIVEQIKSFFNK